MYQFTIQYIDKQCQFNIVLNKHTSTGYTIPITVSLSVLGNHAEFDVDSANLQEFIQQCQHKKMTPRFRSHIQNTIRSPPIDSASRGMHPHSTDSSLTS